MMLHEYGGVFLEFMFYLLQYQLMFISIPVTNSIFVKSEWRVDVDKEKVSLKNLYQKSRRQS